MFLDIINPKRETWLDKVNELSKLSIQLIQQKNVLLDQIKSTSLTEQRAALTQLLINMKCKIRSLRKVEKSRKKGQK